MDEESFRKHKPFAGPTKPSMLRRRIGHDYTSRCIYLVTMTTEGRRPLLGTLVGNADAPSGTADAPHIALTPLGEQVRQAWMANEEHYPGVMILATMVMPDHLHGIIFIREEAKVNLGTIIKGFKAGCNKAYRHLLLPPQQPLLPQGGSTERQEGQQGQQNQQGQQSQQSQQNALLPQEGQQGQQGQRGQQNALLPQGGSTERQQGQQGQEGQQGQQGQQNALLPQGGSTKPAAFFVVRKGAKAQSFFMDKNLQKSIKNILTRSYFRQILEDLCPLNMMKLRVPRVFAYIKYLQRTTGLQDFCIIDSTQRKIRFIRLSYT